MRSLYGRPRKHEIAVLNINKLGLSCKDLLKLNVIETNFLQLLVFIEGPVVRFKMSVKPKYIGP